MFVWKSTYNRLQRDLDDAERDNAVLQSNYDKLRVERDAIKVSLDKEIASRQSYVDKADASNKEFSEKLDNYAMQLDEAIIKARKGLEEAKTQFTAELSEKDDEINRLTAVISGNNATIEKFNLRVIELESIVAKHEASKQPLPSEIATTAAKLDEEVKVRPKKKSKNSGQFPRAVKNPEMQ